MKELNNIKVAKKVLEDNSRVLYGIFGVIKGSGLFPPIEFLNEFFMQGSDPCDQDNRMSSWKPFKLNKEEYIQIFLWWKEKCPGVQINDLCERNWDDWALALIEKDYEI